MGVTRDPDTQAAIDLAREEPEPMFVRGRIDCEHPGYNGTATLDDAPPADSITLRGPELVAYQALRDAAAQAHAAQQSMATTGQVLRDAIQKLCAVIAPGTKP